MPTAALQGPGLEALIARVDTTDADQLRRTASAMDRAADTVTESRAGLTGAASGSEHYWQGTAGQAFRAYGSNLRARLDALSEALRVIARSLRAHAEVTDEAQRGVVAANSILSQAGAYATQDAAYEQVRTEARRVAERATSAFHQSELETRARLWAVGEQAPLGIPLAELPPEPPQSWWQTLLLGPVDRQYWTALGGARMRAGTEGRLPPGLERDEVDFSRYDPTRPLFGHDEDGNLVPAFMADPEVGDDGILEGAPPAAAVLKFVLRGTKAAKTVQGATASTSALVQRSQGWKAGHINTHIREFYRLDKGAPIEPWMRTAFLRVISRAGAEQGKVFTWSLKSGEGGTQPTYAVLYRDPDTKRFVVVQFYKQGKFANQFATAFIPTEAQQAAMLQQIAIKP